MSYVLRSTMRARNWLLSSLLMLSPAAVACGGNKTDAATTPPTPTSGGQSASPSGSAGSTSAGSTTVGPAVGGAGGSSALGSAGMPVSDGGATSSTAGGATGGAPAVHDHCVYGYDPQPSDATMKDGPAEYYPPGKTDPSIVDLTVQPEVISWMNSHFWEAAHVEWHAIRTCSLAGGPRGSKVNICQYTDMIPTDQNCQSTGDGYQFLLFHRHMLEALKQLWPKHSEQFSAFPKFPQSADDVPAQWRSAWQKFNSTDLANAKIAEEIDKPENLAMFPDEGALGFWLQCNMGTSIKGFNLKSGGLHGDLHAHWVRQGNTDHGLGNTSSNVDNYMFWKLHGWMDNVWEKYRTAKGLKRTDPKYIADMLAQCHEMDIEAEICRTGAKPVDDTAPLPVESGFFHEKVRPIFESAANKCSGCHSAAGPEASMSLGGHISSKDIVAGLVNQQAVGGGQFKRVVPGKPDQSWLYLKITAATSSCQATSSGQCFPGPMPPSADGLATVSAADAAIVRQWISDGAKGPE
ncbi:MAG TPA: hypothetical protein VFK05_08190 [Polyangiaceae bacterium]|nr:hypothetical protein [Polyangiaceae bacterium]